MNTLEVHDADLHTETSILLWKLYDMPMNIFQFELDINGDCIVRIDI